MNPATDPITQPPGRSWRQIRQEVNPVAMSRQGRRRRLAGWVRAVAISAMARPMTSVSMCAASTSRARLPVMIDPTTSTTNTDSVITSWMVFSCAAESAP